MEMENSGTMENFTSNEKSKILASRECEARGMASESCSNGNPIYNTNAVKVVDRNTCTRTLLPKRRRTGATLMTLYRNLH